MLLMMPPCLGVILTQMFCMHAAALLDWYESIGVNETVGSVPRRYLSEQTSVRSSVSVTPPAPVARSAPVSPFMPSAPAVRSAPPPAGAIQRAVDEATRLAGASDTLAALEAAVREFDGCPLKRTATKTVFADGAPTARVMLIGEAPGANEDAEGIPFCGASGKLLDKVFAAIGLTRTQNLYISNTIFWRPPGNRRPTNEELAICRPFVIRHIALVNPAVLVLCGSTAVQSLLDTTRAITRLRGQPYQLQDPGLPAPVTAFVTYHPSYLLRSPQQKKLAWQDMLTLQMHIEKHPERFQQGDHN